ncbi:MAG: transcriptional regulator [Bifidobacterium aquikefiri]|uniref:ArsR/SmtB family transcription factor n=1 Tax=Bifidobacterium aquikefiri TaxID=1653207 RepID=UPI0039E83F66
MSSEELSKDTRADGALATIRQDSILLAVANPLRMRILGLLRTEGEKTVGQISELTGVAPGSVSFHLRKLSDAGMVCQDVKPQGDARRSWWKATYQAMRPPTRDDADRTSDADYAYRRAVAVTYESIYERYLDALPDLPQDWHGVGLNEDRIMELTPEETEEMSHEFDELARKWQGRAQHHADHDDRRKVALILQAFPWIP